MLESIKDFLWPPQIGVSSFKSQDPYFLTASEAQRLVTENLKEKWYLSYKLVRWQDCLIATCFGIAHTTFGINQIMVHEREWEIPDYNTDLHVTLHEIAHAKRPVYNIAEAHGKRWEKDFIALCDKYNFSPRRQHKVSNGLWGEFF